MTPNLDGSLALRLRDAVRGDVERRFGELCVSRGILPLADLRRGLEEQERLRAEGEDASLVHALTRLGLVDGGPLWLLLDEVLASPAESPPGRRLGRYELIREVGKGGTGTVYKAYDTQLDRVVAVKTLHGDRTETAGLVREARTLAGLSHKNIVAVYDAGEIDGTPFLCMEYVEGHPLAPGSSIPDLVVKIRKVAEAIALAHARGVVHCDLKPGNILVDRDGEPRIIDFGLAGTPAYMAPERVRREAGAAGPPADVYSLGVCLYEVLTGSRPFEAETPARILEKAVARDFVPPRVRRPEIPRALERIILKAMEGDPARRYAGAADLARALDRKPRGGLWIAAAVAAVVLATGAWFLRPRPAATVDALILETRPFFYIKDADVPARLEKVRARIAELEKDGSPELLRAIGMGYYYAGDWVRAEDALRRAPADGAVHYYLGRLYLDRSIIELLTMPGRSEAERREQSKVWAEKAEAHLRQATTWEGAPELDRRIADAGLAFAKGDTAGAIRLCTDGLKAYAGKLGVEEFSRLLGVLAPPEEHLAHLTRAIEFRPHHPWALLQRGSRLLQDRKFEAAIEDFDRALALSPRLFHAANDRGVARFLAGEYEKALADFNRALEIDPGNGLVLGNRALARASLRDLKGAIEDGTKAIAVYPFPAPMLFNRGIHRLALGDLDGAFKDAEEGLKREPSASRGYSLRGNVHLHRKQWAEATSDFEKALALDARNVDARAGRGVVRLNRGDRSGALQDLEEALKVQPTFPIALFHRGSMKAEDGDMEGAIGDFTKALQVDPVYHAARISRGIAWEDRGEFEKAIADYDDVLKADVKNYEALFNRGMTRLAQGKPAVAAKDLEEALRLAPADWSSRGLAETSLEDARRRGSE